jgi:regulator of sigma E protease
MIWTILIFLAVLSFLVIAHEWGHYYSAKKLGAKVEEFGLGFPPRIWSWKGKDGMEWSLNLIPLGGFVKIKGESGEGRAEKDSFAHRKVWQKLTILSAGVIMNLVVAVGLFGMVLFAGAPTIVEGDLPEHAQVEDRALMVNELVEDGGAAEAGLVIGDIVLSLDGMSVESGEEARDYLRESTEAGIVDIEIERDGTIESFTMSSAYLESLSADGYGISVVETGLLSYPWWLVPWKAITTTFACTVMVVVAFYELLAGLITGTGVSESVSGPVGIAQMTGQVASMGWVYLAQFMALLSINLAVLNVLPFPALDGGRILFVIVEAVRRKPNSARIEAMIHNFGFLLLIGLVIFVTYRDIVNLF